MKKPALFLKIARSAARAAAMLLIFAGIRWVCMAFFVLGKPAMLYTPDWIVKNFLILPTVLSCAMAATRGGRWAFIAPAGYVLGIVLGELLGKLGSQAGPPMYRHDGWIICIAVYFVSVALAVWLMRRARKGGISHD